MQTLFTGLEIICLALAIFVCIGAIEIVFVWVEKLVKNHTNRKLKKMMAVRFKTPNNKSKKR
jgi:hypothetical protein